MNYAIELVFDDESQKVINLPIKVRVEKIDIINYPFNQIMMLDL